MNRLIIRIFPPPFSNVSFLKDFTVQPKESQNSIRRRDKTDILKSERGVRICAGIRKIRRRIRERKKL